MQSPAEWRIFGASIQGALHGNAGMPNQDVWDHWLDAASSSAAVAVADGHGAARHFRSDIGARAAVDAALAALKQFAALGGTPDQSQLQAISVDIERRWNEIVARHISNNPMETSEMPAIAYGSTLLAALLTPRYLALWQIGDGDIVCVDAAGTATLPVPADPTLIGSRTTSLCQPNAWRAFRTQLVTGLPVIVLLSTDGYANSFRSETDFLKIGPDYLRLLQEDPADLRTQLPQLLADSSLHGSGDDTTLAILERVAPLESPPRRKKVQRPFWQRWFGHEEMITLFDDAPD